MLLATLSVSAAKAIGTPATRTNSPCVHPGCGCLLRWRCRCGNRKSSMSCPSRLSSGESQARLAERRSLCQGHGGRGDLSIANCGCSKQGRNQLRLRGPSARRRGDLGLIRSSLYSTLDEGAVAFIDVGGLAYSRNAQMLAPLAGRKSAYDLQRFGNGSRRRQITDHCFR